MTEPLSYATPVERAKTPLIAWLSIGFAVLALLLDVFAVYYVRSTSMAYVNTGNGTGVVLVSSSRPVWIHSLQVLALGLPLLGFVFAIAATVRVPSNKAAAIVGLVLNVLMWALVILIA